MSTFSAILEPGAIRQLGWTLVHFVWQGALLALVFAVLQMVLRNHSANARYLCGCCVLFLMLAAPVVTFSLLEGTESSASQSQIEAPAGPTAATAPGNANAPAQPVVIASSRARWEGLGNLSAYSLEASLPGLVAVWLAGVLLLSLRLAMGSWQVYRFKHARNEPLGESYLRQLRQLKTALAVNRPVRLVKSALVEVPTVIGWLTPVVLLPASTLIGLPPSQLEAILAHELAHIRRHDYLVNLLQKAIETLLFYHPAVWWVSHRVRVEREHCCDDLAVDVCGNRVLYAQALVTLEELRGAPIPLAMAAKDGPLLARIRRLSGFSRPASWYKAEGALPVVLGIFVVVLVCVRLAAGEKGNSAYAGQSGLRQALMESTLGVEDSPPSASTNKNTATERIHLAAQASANTNGNVAEPRRPLNFQIQIGRTNSQDRSKIVSSSKGRQVLFSKLEKLVIPRVAFKETPLTQVIQYVGEQAKAVDPEGKGINFIISNNANQPASDADLADISTPQSVGEITVTIDPPLEDLKLGQVLEAIIRCAAKPLKYSVEDYAIVFSERLAETPMLFTRSFDVQKSDLARRIPQLSDPQASPEQRPERVRRYLETQGIVLEPLKTVIFNERGSALMVRATLAELDRIEELLMNLSMAVQIEVKIAEITLQDNPATRPNLWLDAGLKEEGTEPFKTLAPTNDPQGFYRGIMQYHGLGDGTLVTNLLPATNYAMVGGLLSDEQFREVMEAFDVSFITKRSTLISGVDLLSMPKLTIKNEQQAQIKIADIRTVVIGMTVQTNASTDPSSQSKKPEFQPVTQTFETGSSVDMVPYVSPDHRSIRVTFIGSVNEFLDYATPTKNDTLTAMVHGKKITARKPLPQFRLRGVVEGINIPLGQTAVLGIGPITEERKIKDKVPVLGDIPLLGSLFRNESKRILKKDLWFFITPKLVEAEPEGK